MHLLKALRFLAMTVVCLAACSTSQPASSGQAPTGGSAAPAAASQPSTPKRIVLGIGSNLPSPDARISSPLTGAGEFQQIVSAGLTAEDERGQRLPVLAEAVPSIENGLWTLNPDGSMVTTWHLRDGAVWQDGMPITADVKVGKRTVLSYMLSRVLPVAYDGMREP